MVGRTISHYRVLGLLASGGMGTVYEAEDTKLQRRVLSGIYATKGHDADRREPVCRM